MTKQELQRAIEKIRAFCKREAQQVYFYRDGDISVGHHDGGARGTICNPKSLATRLTQGNQRRCHEQLADEVGKIQSYWSEPLNAALKNSKQALAEGE